MAEVAEVQPWTTEAPFVPPFHFSRDWRADEDPKEMAKRLVETRLKDGSGDLMQLWDGLDAQRKESIQKSGRTTYEFLSFYEPIRNALYDQLFAVISEKMEKIEAFRRKQDEEMNRVRAEEEGKERRKEQERLDREALAEAKAQLKRATDDRDILLREVIRKGLPIPPWVKHIPDWAKPYLGTRKVTFKDV